MIIGTRGGEFALRQVQLVRRMLVDAGVAEASVKVLRTADDVLAEAAVNGSEDGCFALEALESALLSGEVDLAVFCLDQLPLAMPEGLAVGAVPYRGERCEVVVILYAAWEERAPLELKTGARLGVSSPRSHEQLARLRPDIRIIPLQGDVSSQLRRLREKRLDGVMLSALQLELLEVDAGGFAVCKVPVSQLVPLPGQGALAVLCRVEDIDAGNACKLIHDPLVGAEVEVEREVQRRVQGAANTSLAASCERSDGGYRLWVFLGAQDNPRGQTLRERFIADSAEEVIAAACDFLATGGSA